MNKPIDYGFSIVICTYNGVSKLEPTLTHLAQLEIPVDYAVELIVVNNASTDNTSEFLNQVWSRLGCPYSLSIIDEPRAGKGFAVEVGYDAAKYKYILTVDDDNWLVEDYLITALSILNRDSDIGILQGKSNGLFEVTPPEWVHKFSNFFIIGGPISQEGFFEKDNCWVWGAGMVIKNEDWRYLRSKEFSFLTSKIPGKAAGEDNELAIALLMLGRKIYYSPKLSYSHFMPAERMDWKKLQQNFDTYGLVTYYLFLYILIFDAYHNGYAINKTLLRQKFFKFWFGRFTSYSIKHHLGYLLLKKKMHYQLQLKQNNALLKWFLKLSGNALADVEFLQKWMIPLLNSKPNAFILPMK